MGRKTLLQMRTDMKVDLKTTTELSDIELNRSIERAVSDLNRFLPDEKIYEDSLQFSVTGESLTFPKDTSLDAVVADEDLNAAAAGSTAPLDGQPDIPRPLTVTITDANLSINGMVITINGTDKDDQALQETYNYIRGDSKTIVGKKYFKNVLQVDFVQISGGGPGDLLDIGYGAYTEVWVYLINSPIKWQSESATDDASNSIVRNTDFYIDYSNGRVKAIATANIAAEEVCIFAYTKSQIGIDIGSLPDLIRVQRVEYPVGAMPQNFVQYDVFGKWIVVTGGGEDEEQQPMAEDRQFRVYYDASHQMPGEYSPSSVPGFLEDTVLLAAGGYAMLIYALKQEHQAETDLGTMRTKLASADTAHSALSTALTNLKKYLDDNSTNDAESSLSSANGDHSAFATALTNLIKYANNNSDADAAGLLAKITTDIAGLRTAILTALDATNTYLDEVDTTDLQGAEAVWAVYAGTPNYLDGGTEPDIKAYLASGDALLNKTNEGGEGITVPKAYADYAQTTKDSLIATFETRRADWIRQAAARTNAAMGYVQETSQRITNLRTYIEESTGYANISSIFGREAEARNAGVNSYLRQAEGYVAVAASFAREAEARLAEITAYIQAAVQYARAAESEMVLADRYRQESIERRNEVWNIWRDRKQYIGDFTASSVRQMPRY